MKEDYIEEAQNTNAQKRHPVWMKWGVLAACLLLGFIVGFVVPRIVKSAGNKANTGKVKTSCIQATFSIDYGDLNVVVGDADYVFVGTVESEEDTVYKHGSPYTNYIVHVDENIKGNLITDEAIPLQKRGGLSEDGTTIEIFQGDQLPKEGESYIFFAYAQQDGSLLVCGPVSSVSLSADSQRSMDADADGSTEEPTIYEKVLQAYENQTETGRSRSTSIYEAE